jgi:hypothetical protein
MYAKAGFRAVPMALCSLALCFLTPAHRAPGFPALAFAASENTPGEQERLDDGRLDPAWFGPAVEFRTTSLIDYVWVKPGFSVKGMRLRVERWPDPVFLGKERKGRDAAMAFDLAESMPLRIRSTLRRSLKGIAEIVSEGGDLVLSGRLVDYVGKGTMRAANPQATFEIKITDAGSGDLLVAVHQRKFMSISTTAERIDMWLEKFGEALREDLTIAASGDPASS